MVLHEISAVSISSRTAWPAASAAASRLFANFSLATQNSKRGPKFLAEGPSYSLPDTNYSYFMMSFSNVPIPEMKMQGNLNFYCDSEIH